MELLSSGNFNTDSTAPIGNQFSGSSFDGSASDDGRGVEVKFLSKDSDESSANKNDPCKSVVFTEMSGKVDMFNWSFTASTTRPSADSRRTSVDGGRKTSVDGGWPSAANEGSGNLAVDGGRKTSVDGGWPQGRLLHIDDGANAPWKK